MVEYVPVIWVDHVTGQVQGTLINKARLDQMQTQYKLTQSARSLAAAPSDPLEGDWYFDTSRHSLRIFLDGAWYDQLYASTESFTANEFVRWNGTGLITSLITINDVDGLEDELDALTILIDGNTTAIGNKLDKITTVTTNDQVYVKLANGTQSMFDAAVGVVNSSMVRRRPDGQIPVPLIPSSADEATSKQYVDNSGEWGGWIRISTPADLMLVGTGGNYPRNGRYYLANDIDMTGVAFSPRCSGDYTVAFTGTFDGNGHKIIGLTYTGNEQFIGFFGFVHNNGKVLNLELENVDFSSNNNTAGIYVGGIAGYCFAQTSPVYIDNCKVSGKLSGPVNGGGIIGYTLGARITNCINKADLNFSRSCGGITISGSAPTIITDCVNYGNITFSEVISGGYVSGIVACNSSANAGTVARCVNHGNISVQSTVSVYTSGISTYVPLQSTGGIIDCKNYGNFMVSTNTTGSVYSGGICALNSAGTDFLISRCANYGSIKINKPASGNIGIGGIFGWSANGTDSNLGTVSDCYNFGYLSAISTVTSMFMGGIVGARASVSPMRIVNCYNIGKIYTNQTVNTTGGIGGGGNSASNVNMINCYYLMGCLSNINGAVADRISNSTAVVLDGTSTPARSSIQSSGAKTLDQMQPLISDLQDGSSIYYTGSTVSGGVTYPGFDFTNVWRGTHCRGSPKLRERTGSSSGSVSASASAQVMSARPKSLVEQYADMIKTMNEAEAVSEADVMQPEVSPWQS